MEGPVRQTDLELWAMVKTVPPQETFPHGVEQSMPDFLRKVTVMERAVRRATDAGWHPRVVECGATTVDTFAGTVGQLWS